MTLVRSQLLSVSDLNLMHILLHNVLLKFQFIKETNNNLPKELGKHNTIKQNGSSPQDKPVNGTNYLNPLIIIPKGDTIKWV